MKFPSQINVYGDTSFRGSCATESMEQVYFFNWLRREKPKLATIAVHVRNEGKRRKGQLRAMDMYKAEGMNPGAADVIIPAKVPFVCEIKRADHTKSKWQSGQQDYLVSAHQAGAFACLALGYAGAKEACLEWLAQTQS